MSFFTEGEERKFIPENFKLFFQFLYERHKVWYNRFVLGEAKEDWTDNPVFQRTKYTNVYRELDRGTVWWFENIMPITSKKKGQTTGTIQDNQKELIWQTCLYRLINHTILFDAIGIPTISEYRNERRRERWLKAIRDRLENKEKVWTPSHVTLQSNFHGSRYENLITVLGYFMYNIDEVAEFIIPSNNMEACFKRLLKEYGFGPFTSYEVLTDLGYLDWTLFDNDTWANAGPGCMPGIDLIFPGKRKKAEYLPYMEIMRNAQDRAFEQYDIPFMEIAWQGKRLDLRNIEHSLCEFRKYFCEINNVGRPRPKFYQTHDDSLYDGTRIPT